MTAIILAAGFSKRFDGDKLLAEINGKPIIHAVVKNVQKCGFEEIILVSRSSDIKQLLKGADIKVAINENAALGISTSIKCGIINAKSQDSFMFFTADQPFIDEKTIKTLIEAYKAGKGSIVVPKYNGANGNPVIFSAKWRTELLSLTGDTGGRSIIKANPNEVHYVEIANADAGIDIDTRDDYRIYKNKGDS